MKKKCCPRCGRKLKKSRVPGYAYECRYCDEDFYSFEVKKKCESGLGDMSDISRQYDALRRRIPLIGKPDAFVMTRGMYARFSDSEIADIWILVARFNRFTPDNDPYGEHDFGKIVYKGVDIFWKIDNYNGHDGYRYVLTIMLAEDY